MKRSLISLTLAALATATLASAQPGGREEAMSDRTPPTYPELGFVDGWRNDAGESEHNNFVQTQMADGKYVMDAGESTHDAVAKGVG
jgi:hypothetical protein